MLARIHLLATALWSGLAGGAGAGFLAREALGLRQPFVAVAWTTGAALPLLLLTRAHRGEGERGQATVELTSLVLLVALALAALVAVAPRFDGRSFGGFLAFRIVCSIERDCHDGDSSLPRAYGDRDAALVRELAPNLVYERGERQLPVDWRHCRRPACAEGRDEPDLDVHRSDAGERATAFTRLLRRGRRTYLQYWLYYPDSRSVWAGSDWLWERAWQGPRVHGLVDRVPAYPGAHRDDWEAYAVRIDPDGRARVRASSHGHWQGCKEGSCENRWTARTGWARVSRGSHAGHIPLRHEWHGAWPRPYPRRFASPNGRRPRLRWVPLIPGHDLDERTTTSEGLRLVPLETLDARGYRPNDEGVRPPWQKDAYWDPESDDS
ncbi:MAG: hypothetical protein ACRDN8_06565 [Thermoleophilaceae bacterium]